MQITYLNIANNNSFKMNYATKKTESKRTMSNYYVCDTISFKGVHEKNMLNYYKNIMKGYIPNSKEEKEFTESILKFLNTDSKSNKFNENLQKFLSSYDSIENIILNDIEHSAEKLKYVFSSLLEGLDNAKTPMHSEPLTNVLFENFIEAYSDIPAIQEDIKYYSNSNFLKRSIIKDLLKDY